LDKVKKNNKQHRRCLILKPLAITTAYQTFITLADIYNYNRNLQK